MTREQAIEVIKSIINSEHYLGKDECYKDLVDNRIKALQMAITAIENIGHLKDRPCSVCEFNKENGCCKWTCVFTDRLFGDMR